VTTPEFPANVRRFHGWLAETVVSEVNPDGTVRLHGIPLAADVVRPYEPRAGDRVEVLRGRAFAVVLRKLPDLEETSQNKPNVT
jgi:hypothetical protein